MNDIEKARYKKKVIHILTKYGININDEGTPLVVNIKQLQYQIAALKNHRYEYLASKYSSYLAKPEEIEIEKIMPRIEVVTTPKQSQLWQYATSFWSVPVTTGYGRRIRILVFDEQNSKLIGILGLSDPVIGLGVRDQFIGWDKDTRTEKLYHVLSAYVLGALPPYNQILGAKLIALLCQSWDILKIFKEKYTGKETVIKKETKPAELVLIDTMGAYGKSAIYTRLKGWKFVGYTHGSSHLHLTVPELWEIVKQILPEEKFKRYKFGQGPNWKMRTVRDALKLVGFNEKILEIGWKRGYYICPLAVNWKEYLLGEDEEPIYNLYTVEMLKEYWLERWVKPRKKYLLEKLFSEQEINKEAVGDTKFL